jgi:alkylation response protein AidB-like acyl-CoA dehydrogenase
MTRGGDMPLTVSKRSSEASLPTPDVVGRVREISVNDLRPLVAAIDQSGVYPSSILHKLGSAGAFAQHHAYLGEPQNVDLGLAIKLMSVVAEECLSTAFCVWCQDAFGWYLQNTNNRSLRERFQDKAASGAQLGGTGLSNPMKALSGIESLRLHGRRVAGGYRVNGVLPWVSNIDDGHYFGVCFSTDDDGKNIAVALAKEGADGVVARQVTRFIALEGTATKAVTFKDAFIADDDLLADSFTAYARRIRPGFMLLQAGMATGLIRNCISLMRALPQRTREINTSLPFGPNELEDRLTALEASVIKLTTTPTDDKPEFVNSVLHARLDGAQLALEAAQASMIHAGARAYIAGSVYYRRLRESYFIAIVTPATKHLRRDLSVQR